MPTIINYTQNIQLKRYQFSNIFLILIEPESVDEHAMQVVFSTQRGRGCWFSGLAENFLHYGTSPKYKRVSKRGIAALHSVPLAMTLCCEPKAKSQEPTAMHFRLPFARFVKPLCSLWLDRARNQEPRARSQDSRMKNQKEQCINNPKSKILNLTTSH
ncbi:hypothetical protein J8J42_03970 [Chryseobacterium sp. cx-311]|uniref:hypothetical protein n=1 Tax=Marnyiella aurantia TaxID=2758037 RepID=UPI001AE2FE24|nr:hypothetical protein [Marnyiella aurantia]MBP0612204.1 hypothetical protein [Marnyiella aurantia]